MKIFADYNTPYYNNNEKLPIMKQYTINCHYDMVISVDVIADSEAEAMEKAKREAEDMDLNTCGECYGQSQCVADYQELTGDELKRWEREQVKNFVPWLLENETPTEWHYYAQGGAFGWMDYEPDNATALQRHLIATINNGSHPDAALYTRYAKLVAAAAWQREADDLRNRWAKVWEEARKEPEKIRVIVDSTEEDPSAKGNEFGRYFIIDGSMTEGCINHAGQWAVIRSDIVSSPYEVHRPNWRSENHCHDDSTQIICRTENPDNVTRWAEKMIARGRVMDIYTHYY